MQQPLRAAPHLDIAAQVVPDVVAGCSVGIGCLDDAHPHALGCRGGQLGDEVTQQHGRQAGDAVAVKQ
jgi:hypothetical protein